MLKFIVNLNEKFVNLQNIHIIQHKNINENVNNIIVIMYDKYVWKGEITWEKIESSSIL